MPLKIKKRFMPKLWMNLWVATLALSNSLIIIFLLTIMPFKKIQFLNLFLEKSVKQRIIRDQPSSLILTVWLRLIEVLLNQALALPPATLSTDQTSIENSSISAQNLINILIYRKNGLFVLWKMKNLQKYWDKIWSGHSQLRPSKKWKKKS